jgi:hypothetical protein
VDDHLFQLPLRHAIARGDAQVGTQLLGAAVGENAAHVIRLRSRGPSSGRAAGSATAHKVETDFTGEHVRS